VARDRQRAKQRKARRAQQHPGPAPSQPYRADMCPLLSSLLPLAGTSGILGVSLSGAGPAVLVIVEGETEIAAASQAILGAMENLCAPSLLICRFEEAGANQSLRPE